MNINKLFGEEIKNKHKIDVFIIITILFLPLMFFSDAASKYLVVTGSSFSQISLIVRIIFEFIIAFYLLININKSTANYFLYIVMLFIFFILGQALIGNLDNFVINFTEYNKYIFIFLVFLYFKLSLKNKINYEITYKILIFIFLLNIFCIFVGLFFEIEYLKTFYGMDYRYGYNGVISAGNESSFVFVSMISFFYFRAYYERSNKIFLLIATMASLLSGLKGVYIFIALLLLFHVLFNMRKKWLFLVIPLGIYGFGYLINYMEGDHFQTLIEFFMKTLNNEGLIYALLSGRNEILANESVLVVKDWIYLNFLIGGVDVCLYIMEMDFFDLILFFGLFGSGLYIYLFYKSFMHTFIGYNFFTFYIFSLLILAFFGGHFLTSPVSAVYFTLVILYFQNKIKKIYEKNPTY